MKTALILAVLFSLLVCGCAFQSIQRLVEIDATRTEVDSPQSNGLTSTLATNLFHDVANQLGFAVDPVQAGHGFIQYTAHAPSVGPTNQTYLTMMVTDKEINFVSDINGTAQDFTSAKNAAALFEQELDKRHIKYKVAERTGWPFGP